jgi:hypothetical protein
MTPLHIRVMVHHLNHHHVYLPLLSQHHQHHHRRHWFHRHHHRYHDQPVVTSVMGKSNPRLVIVAASLYLTHFLRVCYSIMRVTSNAPNTTLFSLVNNKLPAGVTLTRAPHGGNTWYPLDGTTFQVRCGPNYKRYAHIHTSLHSRGVMISHDRSNRNKTKKNSQMALFEFIGADCFQTPNGTLYFITFCPLFFSNMFFCMPS